MKKRIKENILANKKKIKAWVVVLTAVAAVIIIIPILIFAKNCYYKNLKYVKALEFTDDITALIIYGQDLSGQIGKRDFTLIEKIKDKEGKDESDNIMAAILGVGDILKTKEWKRTISGNSQTTPQIQVIIDETFHMDFFQDTVNIQYKNKKAAYKIPKSVTNEFGEYLWLAMDLNVADIERNLKNQAAVSFLIEDNLFEVDDDEKLSNLLSIESWKELDDFPFEEEPTNIYLMSGTRIFMSFYQKLDVAVVKYNGNTRVFDIPSSVCVNLIEEDRDYVRQAINQYFEIAEDRALLIEVNGKVKEGINTDLSIKSVLQTDRWRPISVPFDFDKDKAEIQITAKNNVLLKFNSEPPIAVLEYGKEIRYFSIPESTCVDIYRLYGISG